jgi:hypothetical protein
MFSSGMHGMGRAGDEENSGRNQSLVQRVHLFGLVETIKNSNGC